MNKRDLVVASLSVAVLVTVALVSGQATRSGNVIDYVQNTTISGRWEELGTITSSQAYPAVGSRTVADVEALAAAKTIIWTPPADASLWEFCFQTTADADSTTLVMLVAGGEYQRDGTTADDYAYGSTFVLTGGKQVGSNSNVFVDTVAPTDGVLTFTEYDSAADRICIVRGDGLSMGRVTFIATTLQGSSTCYVYGKYFD